MKRREFLYLTTGLPLMPLFGSRMPSAWHLGHHGDFYFQQYASNVYIMHGINSGKDADAHCFVHNVSVIEATHGLIVIDPGASYYVGTEVMKQIERISKKPIIAVVNTHHHSDHWFANGALKEKFPNVEIYGHRLLEKAAKKQYFSIKERAFRSTKKAKYIVYPDKYLHRGQTLHIDSEVFQVMHPAHAHTSTDIALWYPKSDTFFLGDIALESTLGNFAGYSSILGNIDFLEKIKKRHRLYVPGHGQSGNYKSVVEAYLFYLRTIRDEVIKAYDMGKGIFELQEAKKHVLEKFAWRETFNFPLKYIDSHMQFVYMELDQRW
jgi:glyoxylase-like metal-dependent hydrolase (beta-lactamase superfamily II)